MLTTQLPGFREVTQDSQKTFRALLETLSMPGTVQRVDVELTPPKELGLACAAACLALLDLETVVWLQPGFSTDVQNWLRFHTGCRFTTELEDAAFVIVLDLDEIALDELNWGSAETPEASATLLAQVDSLQHGKSVVLTGPGILSKQAISPTVPTSFWQGWQRNHHSYPRGIDVFLFEADRVMGLPRSVNAKGGE